MTAEPRPGSGTPDADDGHTINVGPVTVADPGSGTPADDRPTSTPHNRNVEPWNCLTCNPNGWPRAKWIDNERRRRSYNAEAQRTRPAPPAAPVDGLDADFLPRALRGWAKHVRAEDFRTAAEVMELAAIVLEGRAPVDGPVLDEAKRRRAMVFAEVRNDQIREGDLLANHATITVHRVGPCIVKWGGRAYELAEGEVFIGCGDGNPHGFAISRCDANDTHIVGRLAAPSPAPLDVRKLPEWEALRELVADEMGATPGLDHIAAMDAIADAAEALLAAADREEPTDA